MRLRDSQGREVRVGHELGRGGEGTVYEIAGASDRVAKIYHERVSHGKEAKLTAMASLATDALLKIAAWPMATLHAEKGGHLTGIVMPRVTDHRDVHLLYSPSQRKALFGTADWSFLVHTARNVAHAFETIHSLGHVIGDVNQGNVLVSSRATVKLIDCDSFQIRAGAHLYLCEVGVGHFTPPELQGRSFAGVERSANHDRFGLAVMCFHLIFMGRHPFAGRFHGKGDMPIEKAIAEHRFAFSQNAANRQMTPPPHALRLGHVSFQLASLFERAFSSNGTKEHGRPTAHEWLVALDALLIKGELTRCSTYPGHTYHKALKLCPWCEIERGGGPDFFISLTVGARLQSGFDLNEVWVAISLVASPPPLSQLAGGLPGVGAAVVGRPLPSRFNTRRRVALGVGIAALLVAIAAMVGVLPGGAGWLSFVLAAAGVITYNDSGLREERKQRAAALDQARSAFAPLKERWEREVQEGIRRFTEKRGELDRKREEYLGLTSAHQRERALLSAKREQLQRARYLDTFYIANAQIPRIGPGLKEALRSWGIETAADVTASKVDEVPGFGPTRVEELLKWRAAIERRFTFEPRRDVDPADIAALDHRFAMKRQGIERLLGSGASELRSVAGTVKQRNDAMMPDLIRLARTLQQREADARVA